MRESWAIDKDYFRDILSAMNSLFRDDVNEQEKAAFELNAAIAVRCGYEESCTVERRDDGSLVMWDAECQTCPDYVKILGRRRASELLEMFEIIAANFNPLD